MNDIEGRRNKVFEDDLAKEEEEFAGGRKRQDSGFVASSNESIVPLPELYSAQAPRRSPSMPNLRVYSGEQQNLNEEVFTLDDSAQSMVSIGTSTDDLPFSSVSQQNNPRLTESVLIEKKSFNCTGIDFGIGGVYVKDYDPKEISFKKGTFSVGDEVLSINDYPLHGLTDMEAFSFFARSGPVVKLKIVKGVFSDKAEGMSVSSADFQLSDSSDDEESSSTDKPSPTSTTPLKNTATTSNTSLQRLPKVIADANNLSFDCSPNSESNGESSLMQNQSDLILLKTVHTINTSQPDQSTPFQKTESNEPETVRLSNSTAKPQFPQNGIHTGSIPVELQELMRYHLAYPGLFLEFLATLHTKDKPFRKPSRCNSESSECCVHSRNASSERNRHHSRHCSNEQCCHGVFAYSDHSNQRHHRNCSCDSVRYTLQHEDFSKEQNATKFNRVNNVDEPMIKHVNPVTHCPNGILRSQSGDSNAPIFTVDSYSRHHQSHLTNQPQTQPSSQQKQQLEQHHSQQILEQNKPTDNKQLTQSEHEQYLYYQELLKQKASLEQIVQQQQQQQQLKQIQSNQSTELMNSVPGNEHHENIVVQRGYNNDYIVPVNGTTFPNVTTVYAKTIHRNKDSSPVRRTSPVVFPSQSVPRFAATSISNPKNTSVTSSSPQSSFCSTTVPRKPPPGYASIQKSSSNSSGDGSTTRDVASLDNEFMRKMTQKYSEPRFRKNPPPYNTAISLKTNSETNLTTLEYSDGVTLRHKGKDRRSANRSRPHSYTDSGVIVSDINTRQSKLNTSLDESEKRKHPKRTHSMPAVKHFEMRPVSAQSFRPETAIHDDAPPLTFSQQQVNPQPPQPQQLLAQPYQNLSLQTTAPNNNNNNNQLHPSENEQNQQPHMMNPSGYQQAPKKLKTRQQRARESFNRRKSIDSGTLRKLAEEMYENPVLGGEFPILSQLLGESQFSAIERRSQGLYRHKSTEALYTQF